MEAAGLSVGVVALAGLFNNAVDSFEYVQIAKSFGRDFQTSLLKLDNARLRLSRWGQSVGLDGDLRDVQTLNQIFGSAGDVDKAKDNLGHILELFEEVEGASNKYKSRAKPNDASLVVYRPQTDLERVPASLHEKMRQLSIKRQNTTSLLKKASWALYEKKSLNRLIEDIVDLVGALEGLFKATEPARRQLCETEVSEIGKDEELSVLKEIAVSVDKSLADAIKAVTGKGGGNQYNVSFSGSTNYGQQMGHFSGTQNNTFGGPR